MTRVVVGLSGGVDSSVAAFLLKQQGYDVIGIFMKNWHDESVTISDECPWIDDSNDALIVSQQLNIPFQVLDLSVEYKNRIVNYMFDEYRNGKTPNPDVLCNREIKFDVFLKAALNIGADFVATGHYCQKYKNDEGIFSLKAAVDKNKDQSYFLCQITQDQLKQVLFPIGHLKKDEVRKIAEQNKLITASKKDSQGLCFVGKISLPIFLQQKLKPKTGKIVEIEEDHIEIMNYRENLKSNKSLELLTKPFQFNEKDGNQVGEHNGAHYYTIGQRKGLNIGGRPHPSFVISIDIINNLVFTCQKENHKGLYRKVLKIKKDSVNWITGETDLMTGENGNFDFRIRYRQPLQKGTLIKENNNIFIVFLEFQKGIAPGQFAAWYRNNELVGSGVIES